MGSIPTLFYCDLVAQLVERVPHTHEVQAMSIDLKMVAWVVLPCRAMVKTWLILDQILLSHFDWSKNMAFTVAILPFMAIVKTLKIFSSERI